MNSLDRKLRKRLIRTGNLAEEQADAAASLAEQKGLSFAECLRRLRLVDPKVLARNLARLNGREFLDLESFDPDEIVLRYLRPSLARRYRAIPVGILADRLVVAVDEAMDILEIDELKVKTGRPLEVVLATREAIDAALEKHYSSDRDRASSPDVSVSAVEQRCATEAEGAGPSRSADGTGGNTVPGEADWTPSTMHRKATIREAPETGLTCPSGQESPDRATWDDPRDIHNQDTIAGLTPPTVGATLYSHLTRVVSLHDLSTLELAVERSSIAGNNDAGDREMPAAWTSPVDPFPASPDGGVLSLLRDVLSEALQRRAEEVEFVPGGEEPSRARLRLRGLWQECSDYPASHHGALTALVRELAGIAKDLTGPQEAAFLIKGDRKPVPLVACFLPGARGERCLLRFPEHTALIQDPIRVLGLDAAARTDLEERLDGRGGGVLFISSESSRLSQQLYASLLHQQALRGRTVISLEWPMEREIPGVTQLNCPSEESVLDGLEHIALQAPDVGAVAVIPNGNVLKRTVELGLQGRTLIAAFTVPESRVALVTYRSAGLDPMALTRGVIAHLHVSQVPLLCPQCRRGLEHGSEAVPDWACDLNPTCLREARGCPACSGSGRQGVHWIVENYRPDPEGTGGFVRRRGREDVLRQLASEGMIDVRDARVSEPEELAGIPIS